MALMASIDEHALHEHTIGLNNEQKTQAALFCFAVTTPHTDEFECVLTRPQFVTVIEQLKSINERNEVMDKHALRHAFIDTLKQINPHYSKDAA